MPQRTSFSTQRIVLENILRSNLITTSSREFCLEQLRDLLPNLWKSIDTATAFTFILFTKGFKLLIFCSNNAVVRSETEYLLHFTFWSHADWKWRCTLLQLENILFKYIGHLKKWMQPQCSVLPPENESKSNLDSVRGMTPLNASPYGHIL